VDYQNAFAISAAGMSVERLRVEVSALNLANANTVAEAGGAVFQPLRVIARSAGAAPPGDPEAFFSLVGNGLSGPVASIETAQLPPRRVLEPGHPLADAQGFVSYAAVDPATEMLTLMSATRAYEANVAAMNAARTMAMKALDIGGTT
jgi:flagellar basal-body rod protein FlgC